MRLGNASCPILEVTVGWYHNFSKDPKTVDELERSAIVIAAESV